jgi:hypothetical protein
MGRPTTRFASRAVFTLAAHRMGRASVWVLAAALIAARANAEPPSTDVPSAQTTSRIEIDARPSIDAPSTARGVAADVSAFIPGLLVHGAGHFVAGDTRTGQRLLALEGLGLGVFAAGGVPLVLTGASRRIVGTAAALTIGGVALFAISALADIYGVVAPAGGFGGAPAALPTWQAELGYRYVYNPVFAYRSFAVYGVELRSRRLRVAASAWLAADDPNARLRLLAGYRVWSGARHVTSPATDGSYLEWQAAFTRHAYLSDRFAVTTGETALAGRVDLVRIGPSLAGSFAEGSVGVALQNYDYRVNGVGSDTNQLLLARFAYGIYFGGGTRRGPDGEILAYYDHRHDGFAAGLKLGGLGSGVAGHFGLEGRCYFNESWGVAAEVLAGSAWVSGVSLVFRRGGAR